MYNALRQHDKIERLQYIIDRIASSGTISMESADAIEREVPGVIASIDPDIMFDIDESETGVGIALEASIEGMSRMKIAFIVAIVAFLAKYIMSLNKGYTFSTSGGGGGGWGGSAPPTFSTEAPVTTDKHWDDVSQADTALNEDLDKLHKDYSEAFNKLKSQGINNNVLGGMEKNKALKRLCNTLLPDLIKANKPEGTGIDAVGWTMFTTGSGMSGAGMIAQVQFKPFMEVDDKSKDVTEAQIKNLEAVLKVIDSRYTIAQVFGQGYVQPEKGTNGRPNVVRGLLIPTFILNEECQKDTLGLISAIIKMIDNSASIESDLKSFESVVKSTEQSKPDSNMGGEYSNNLWKWLANNLGKNSDVKTPIRTYLNDLITILNLNSYQGEYINTPTINASLKRFVRATIDGKDFDNHTQDTDEVISSAQPGDFEATIKLLTGTNGDIKTRLSAALNVFDDARKSLDDKQTTVTKIGDSARELEEAMSNVVAYAKANNKGFDDNAFNSTSSIGGKSGGEDKLGEYNEGAPIETLNKNLAPMFNLVSSLIQVLLMSMASAAKYNTELAKFSKGRIDLIIGKKQAMAKELYEITKAINDVINESKMNG